MSDQGACVPSGVAGRSRCWKQDVDSVVPCCMSKCVQEVQGWNPCCRLFCVIMRATAIIIIIIITGK